MSFKERSLWLALLIIIVGSSMVAYDNIINSPSFADFQPDKPEPQLDFNQEIVSIYLRPTDGDAIFSDDVLNEYHVQSVIGNDAIASLTNQPKTIDILYIHPDIYNRISESWLQEQYRQGTMIVAIDIPLSQITKTMGVIPPAPDFTYPDIEHHVTMLMSRPNTMGGRLRKSYADALWDPEQLVSNMDLQIRTAIANGAVKLHE